MEKFEKHEIFFLDCNGWGEARIENIIKLLDDVIDNFYESFGGRIVTPAPVYVSNSSLKNPPILLPQIIKNANYVDIYLNTRDRLWSQYVYQFAHELCHLVIDTDFPAPNDKFGWFEETLCEISSLYCLRKMAFKWKKDPPYDVWKDYSDSLDDYVSEIMKNSEIIPDSSFKKWFDGNLNSLYLDRYKRDENQIIAIKLLPLFQSDPMSWKLIRYIHKINVRDEMDFKDYLCIWREIVPKNLVNKIDALESSLLQ